MFETDFSYLFSDNGNANKKFSKKESSKENKEEQFRNDAYQAQEYFSHDKFTFVQVMVDLSNKRLPQKSNKVAS